MRTYPVTYLFKEEVVVIKSFGASPVTTGSQRISINKYTNIKVSPSKPVYLKFSNKLYNAIYNIDDSDTQYFEVVGSIPSIAVGGTITVLQPGIAPIYNQAPSFTDIYDYFKTTPSVVPEINTSSTPFYGYISRGVDGLLSSNDKYKLNQLKYPYKTAFTSLTAGIFTTVFRSFYTGTGANVYDFAITGFYNNLSIQLTLMEGQATEQASVIIDYNDDTVFGEASLNGELKILLHVYKHSTTQAMRYVVDVQVRFDQVSGVYNAYSTVNDHAQLKDVSESNAYTLQQTKTIQLNSGDSAEFDTSTIFINSKTIKRTIKYGDTNNFTRTTDTTNLITLGNGVYRMMYDGTTLNVPSTLNDGNKLTYIRYQTDASTNGTNALAIANGKMYVGNIDQNGGKIYWNEMLGVLSKIPATSIIQDEANRFVTDTQMNLWNTMSATLGDSSIYWHNTVSAIKTDLIGRAGNAHKGQQFIVLNDNSRWNRCVTYTFNGTSFEASSINALAVDSLTEKSLMSHDSTFLRITRSYLFQHYQGRTTYTQGTNAPVYEPVAAYTYVNNDSDDLVINKDGYKSRISTSGVSSTLLTVTNLAKSTGFKPIGTDSASYGKTEVYAGDYSVSVGSLLNVHNRSIGIGRNITNYSSLGTAPAKYTNIYPASNSVTHFTNTIGLGYNIRFTANGQIVIGELPNTDIPTTYAFVINCFTSANYKGSAPSGTGDAFNPHTFAIDNQSYTNARGYKAYTYDDTWFLMAGGGVLKNKIKEYAYVKLVPTTAANVSATTVYPIRYKLLAGEDLNQADNSFI
jgi:hypothetical protein